MKQRSCCFTANCRTASSSPASSGAWPRPAVCRIPCSTCCASSARRPPHGRPANLRQRPGPLRPGDRRLLPRRLPAKSRATDASGSLAVATQYRLSRAWKRSPRPDLGHAANFLWMCAAGGAAGRRSRPGRVADSVRRARVQRLDLRRPRRLFHVGRPALGNRRRHRRALKGPAHGDANQKVMEGLEAVGGPDRAEAWGVLARKERIMGFGHRVYKAETLRRHPETVRPEGVEGGRRLTGREPPRSSRHPRRRRAPVSQPGLALGPVDYALGLEVRCTPRSS